MKVEVVKALRTVLGRTGSANRESICRVENLSRGGPLSFVFPHTRTCFSVSPFSCCSLSLTRRPLHTPLHASEVQVSVSNLRVCDGLVR